MVYFTPFLSNQIKMRTATTTSQGAQATQDSSQESLIWSPEQAIYGPVPEMTPGQPLYDPNNVCYAGVEHFEWATDHSMVVTYVCNYLGNISYLLTDMNIYYPVAVTIPLP